MHYICYIFRIICKIYFWPPEGPATAAVGPGAASPSLCPSSPSYTFPELSSPSYTFAQPLSKLCPKNCMIDHLNLTRLRLSCPFEPISFQLI